MKRREIVLVDGNGAEIRSMDVSDIDHANAQLDLIAVVRTQCDMGHWHENGRIQLIPWGPRLTEHEH